MAAGISIIGYATYGLFRNWASNEVVLISSNTFEDEQFRQAAVKFTKDSIKELTESTEVQQYVTDLLGISVTNLAKQEYIINGLSNLLSKAIESKQVKDSSKESVSNAINDLVNSDDHKLMRETISKYLSEELRAQLSNKENQYIFSVFTKNAIWRIFSGK